MARDRNMVDVLRKAIRQSGLTHYRIAKTAGIDAGQLDRFVTGKRLLRLDTAAKLCVALGLELKPKS